MQDYGQPAGGAPPPPPPPPPPPGAGGVPPPPPPGGMPPPGFEPRKKKSSLPFVGGIFLLLGAIILFVSIALAASVLGVIESEGYGELEAGDEARDALNILWAQCVVVPLIGAIFMILGAVFGMRRKNFMMAMLGGLIGFICALIGGLIYVAGIMIPNTIALTGFVFGLIGWILILAGKKGFD